MWGRAEGVRREAKVLSTRCAIRLFSRRNRSLRSRRFFPLRTPGVPPYPPGVRPRNVMKAFFQGRPRRPHRSLLCGYSRREEEAQILLPPHPAGPSPLPHPPMMMMVMEEGSPEMW